MPDATGTMKRRKQRIAVAFVVATIIYVVGEYITIGLHHDTPDPDARQLHRV